MKWGERMGAGRAHARHSLKRKDGFMMKQLRANFFQLSNDLFAYGLTPIQLTVYSYLVCVTGAREKCWPGMKTISARCGCSTSAARAAIKVLAEREFIRKVAVYETDSRGRHRQANNHYYILELPGLPQARQTTYREAAAETPA